MALPSHQIEAFLAVARTRNFSEAAKALGVTQSALSQRVLNLEEALESKLFVRGSKGVTLTDLGEELMKHSQWAERLESEFLARLKTKDRKELAGIVRVAGFSSVVRSVVLPALGELVCENPSLQLEVSSREMRDLPGLLRSGEADFILLGHEMERAGVLSRRLGYEENVLVEPKAASLRSEVYLDHDPEDSTTERFLRLNRMGTKGLRRSFLDDIYGILDGVALGFGRAVVPRHLAARTPGLRIVDSFKPLREPVLLCYYDQPYLPKLETAVIEALVSGSPRFLSGLKSLTW